MQLVNDNPSTAHSSSQLSDMKKPIQLHSLVRKAEALSSTVVVVVALGDPWLLSSYITKVNLA
jgi:hypothetical protein